MPEHDDLMPRAERLFDGKAGDPFDATSLRRNYQGLVDADDASMASGRQKDTRPTGPSEGDHSGTERLLALAISREYMYAMLGLILGLTCIVAGTILGLHGVAGSTSWTAKALGLESSINDAAPGVVLFVVGLFYVWITRPKVRLKNLRG